MLDVQIEDVRETLAEIEETTWGVTLLEIDGERFVVLPDGAGRGKRDLAAAVRAARRGSERLGPGLQDARRDVARTLELMRQRSQKRDQELGHSR